MTNRLFRPLAALILSLAFVSPAAAANKEHQQLMADIRMLQEQAQLLQNLLGTLNETLKAVNARLDQQADANRKAFADQKLLVDNLTKDLGVVREKVDDNNVRVGSLSQEVDALRQLVQQALARPAAPPPVDTSGAPLFPGPVPTSSTPPAANSRAGGDRHISHESVGTGVRRLWGRPLRSRDRRLHRLHPRLPQARSGRRCAVLDRAVVPAGCKK